MDPPVPPPSGPGPGPAPGVSGREVQRMIRGMENSGLPQAPLQPRTARPRGQAPALPAFGEGIPMAQTPAAAPRVGWIHAVTTKDSNGKFFCRE